MQAIAEKKKNEIAIDDSDFIHESVTFTYSKADISSGSEAKTDKGMVEKISTKAIKVDYIDDEIKNKMLGIDDNPFKCVYLVDVKVINHNGNPAFYQIIKLHTSTLEEEIKDLG